MSVQAFYGGHSAAASWISHSFPAQYSRAVTGSPTWRLVEVIMFPLASQLGHVRTTARAIVYLAETAKLFAKVLK